MRSVASKNKARGRAYQTKLAEMAGGMNIGTLGGEDVMHDEFSYEAKTYNPKAKSHKGRDWKGEKLLLAIDHRAKHLDAWVKVNVLSREPLILMRWALWSNLHLFEYPDTLKNDEVYLSSFKGYTYMKQAEDNCPEGKIPVVAVHTTGLRHRNDIVIIYQQYLNSLLKKYLTKAFN
jgi:hypothetical protein